jgi:hypothetical protein
MATRDPRFPLPPAWWWVLLLAAAARLAGADDPYRYFDWTVTYGPINPLGTTQQVLLYASTTEIVASSPL